MRPQLTRPLHEMARQVCRPVPDNERRHRALNPLCEEDAKLLEAISRGAFIRTRDLCELLCTKSTAPELRWRNAARITRRIRLPRANRLEEAGGGEN